MSALLDGVAGKRVTDDALVAAYKQAGNVHRAGELVGLNGSTVHERLVRLGVTRAHPRWTEADDERLRKEYVLFRDVGKLATLAASMGRTAPFLNRQAKRLGLTASLAGRPRPWAGKWKHLSDDAARALFNRFLRYRKGSVKRVCQSMGITGESWQQFAREMKRRFPDEWEISAEARETKSTMYRFGRAFEYRTRDDLRARGYFVLRSPQSRSPIDLVAIKRGAVLFVQCKRGAQLGVPEWNSLLALAESCGALALCASMPGPRGVEYRRLLQAKDGSRRDQPWGSYLP